MGRLINACIVLAIALIISINIVKIQCIPATADGELFGISCRDIFAFILQGVFEIGGYFVPSAAVFAVLIVVSGMLIGFFIRPKAQ
jgi:hypothetical protein